jgi:hypothetical protein
MGLTAATSASTIADYIRKFSIAMKNIDPDILIIGPESAQFGNDHGTNSSGFNNASNKIMDDLVNDPANASSIMGQITSTESPNAAGKYYVDILSFHYYPQFITNRDDVLLDPSNTQNGFYGNIRDDGSPTNQWKGLAEMVNNNSTGRSFSGNNAIGIACTEFNLDHNFNDNSKTDDSQAGYEDVILSDKLRSFLAGQWMAEVMYYGMQGVTDANGKYDLTMINPWSTIEGDCTEGQGYISNCSNAVHERRPSYNHYKMVATNVWEKNPVTNTFYPNVHTCSACSTYKAFANVLVDPITLTPEIGVFIMNQYEQSPRGTDVSTKSFRINFSSSSVSGGEDILFDFNTSLSASDYTATITNETSLFLHFDNSGNFLSSSVYTLQQAMGGGAPSRVANSTDNLYTQTNYDNYTGDDYADIVINDGTNAITVSSSDYQVISFFNTCTINTVGSGSYTIPAGQVVTFLPTPAPH